MTDTGTKVIRVTDLKTHFHSQRMVAGKTPRPVRAVDGVSFGIDHGETVGVVGESGCGKTTLGRTMLRLIEPTAGKIEFWHESRSVDLTAIKPAELRVLRREMNMVFQDPFSSLNPRMNVKTIISAIFVALLLPIGANAQTTDAGDMSNVKTIAVSRGLTETGRNCSTCHRDVDPGIVSDWKYSRHGHVGVSCGDGHQVESDSPMAINHEDIFDMDDYDTSLLDPSVHISTLVPPSTCAAISIMHGRQHRSP